MARVTTAEGCSAHSTYRRRPGPGPLDIEDKRRDLVSKRHKTRHVWQTFSLHREHDFSRKRRSHNVAYVVVTVVSTCLPALLIPLFSHVLVRSPLFSSSHYLFPISFVPRRRWPVSCIPGAPSSILVDELSQHHSLVFCIFTFSPPVFSCLPSPTHLPASSSLPSL